MGAVQAQARTGQQEDGQDRRGGSGGDLILITRKHTLPLFTFDGIGKITEAEKPPLVPSCTEACHKFHKPLPCRRFFLTPPPSLIALNININNQTVRLQDALAEAEAAVMEAEAVSEGTGRPVGPGTNAAQQRRPPLSPGASADEDIRGLVATVDKARRAAQNASQVPTRWFATPSPSLTHPTMAHVDVSAVATARVLFPWEAEAELLLISLSPPTRVVQDYFFLLFFCGLGRARRGVVVDPVKPTRLNISKYQGPSLPDYAYTGVRVFKYNVPSIR